MSAIISKSAIQRVAKDVTHRLASHPQALEIGLLVYGFLTIISLIVAVGLGGLPTGVAFACALAAIAIATSGLALLKLHQLLHKQGHPVAVSSLALEDLERPVGFDVITPPSFENEVSASIDPVEVANDEAVDILPAEIHHQPAAKSELPSAPLEIPSMEQAPRFVRTPIVAIPQRRVTIIRGDVVDADNQSAPVCNAERLAQAVAFKATNPVAADRRILIPLDLATLDQGFTNEAVDLMLDHEAIALSIMFEIDGDALVRHSDAAIRFIDELTSEGYSVALVLHQAPSLVDFVAKKAMWENVSHVLLPAHAILGAGEQTVELFQSMGAQLIATEVGSESDVLELLDFNITHAAGALFERRPASTAPAQTVSVAKPKRSKGNAKQQADAKLDAYQKASQKAGPAKPVKKARAKPSAAVATSNEAQSAVESPTVVKPKHKSSMAIRATKEKTPRRMTRMRLLRSQIEPSGSSESSAPNNGSPPVATQKTKRKAQ